MPLKSWCKNYYGRRNNRLKLLRVSDGKHILWLDKGSVRAVISDNDPPTDGFEQLQLALVRSNNNPQWFLRDQQRWLGIDENKALAILDTVDANLDENLCKLVIEAIKYDHTRQLQEDLVMGFIKRLKNMFDHAGLYLFELLQNAVDEGARRVSFEIHDTTLVFQHDGEIFSASDALGMSAVGASGKSGRTIGFMGLGLKSVYNRFDRVVVCDGMWSFCFDRPDDTNNGGWKFLPQWCEDTIRPENGFRCRFDLSRVQGGANTLLTKDLENLDDATPVLLARRVLKNSSTPKAESDTWELNWNKKIIAVVHPPGYGRGARGRPARRSAMAAAM